MDKNRDQVGGTHYSEMAIQPIEYINKNALPFAEGCVVKYVSRHKAKNGLQDLVKAMQNIAFILERDYGAGTKVEVYAPEENKTYNFKWGI